jgi:hypothetical protein
MNIWKDETYMILLFGGTLDQVPDDVEVYQAKKRLLNYHWREYTLFFKNLVVPKPEEKQLLVKNIHEEIRHLEKEGQWLRLKRGFFGMIEQNLSRWW